MCVIHEDGGNAEKVVQLPPFVVTASRINTLELQMVMRVMTMNWNAAIGGFVVGSTADSVRIVSRPNVQHEPNSEEPAQVTHITEVGQTTVGGRVVITLQFHYSDNTTRTASYILTANRLWNHYQGQWWSAPTDYSENWTPEPNGLPAPVLTPPDSGGGGGGSNEHQN